jgi:hypothetical protein
VNISLIAFIAMDNPAARTWPGEGRPLPMIVPFTIMKALIVTFTIIGWPPFVSQSGRWQ